jgi:hypothetical protein
VTESEWLSCSDPLAMFGFLHGRAGGRKFRLFAAACARDDLATAGESEEEKALPPPYRYETAIAEAEAFADGQGTLTNRGGWMVGLRVCDVITDEDIALSALGFDADVGLWTAGPPERVVPERIRRYSTHPAHYLRDLFTSLFRRRPSDPAWQAPAVAALARAAYEERALPIGHLDPARLGVLADALEEAGCTDPDLLGHLRGAGPHVRGCWALDTVLGKE